MCQVQSLFIYKLHLLAHLKFGKYSSIKEGKNYERYINIQEENCIKYYIAELDFINYFS